MPTFSVMENEVSLRQAIELLLRDKSRVIFFVDHDNRIFASFSEGDALRALLAGHNLEESVQAALHPAPLTLSNSASEFEIRSKLKSYLHTAIPIVSADGKLERVVTYDELI